MILVSGIALSLAWLAFLVIRPSPVSIIGFMLTLAFTLGYAVGLVFKARRG